jgi:regulator of RNase E activity RraB
MPVAVGGLIFCFDAVITRPLNRDTLIEDLDTLLKIADKNKVHYDGWGTQYIEPVQ